jgi:hypothetical protein
MDQLLVRTCQGQRDFKGVPPNHWLDLDLLHEPAACAAAIRRTLGLP